MPGLYSVIIRYRLKYHPRAPVEKKGHGEQEEEPESFHGFSTMGESEDFISSSSAACSAVDFPSNSGMRLFISLIASGASDATSAIMAAIGIIDLPGYVIGKY